MAVFCDSLRILLCLFLYPWSLKPPPGSLSCLQALWGSLMYAWLIASFTPALQKTQPAACLKATIYMFKVILGICQKTEKKKKKTMYTLPRWQIPCECTMLIIYKMADKSHFILYIKKAFRNFVLSSQQSREFSHPPPCWKLWLVRLWLCHVWYRESQNLRSHGFTMDFLLGSKTRHPSGSRRPSSMIKALTNVWPQTALGRRPLR